MKRALIALAALFAAGAANAAEWKIVKGASALTFESALGGAPFTGRFEEFDGVIIFDPDDLAGASISVVVNLASARTGDRQKDAALPGRDWFDAAKFPVATFRSKSLRATGEGTYRALGVLTLKDVSRPTTLDFALKIDGDKARAVGRAVLNRTEFGVGLGEFTGEDWVPHAVTVKFDIAAGQ